PQATIARLFPADPWGSAFRLNLHAEPGGIMNAEIVQSPIRSGADPAPEPPQSVAGSLIGVFTEPRPTFAAMTSKPRLLAPMLVLVVFQLLFGLVLAQSGILKNDSVAKMEAKNAPQEQIDAVTRFMESPVRFVFAATAP